jgi:hypothetical protein
MTQIYQVVGNNAGACLDGADYQPFGKLFLNRL